MAPPISVDVFADPGLPTRLVDELLEWADTQDTPYELSVNAKSIPLCPDGTLNLEEVRGWSREHGTHAAVIVTEIPRRNGARPTIASLYPANSLVVISLPALGFHDLARRLQRAVLGSLDVVTRSSTTEGPDPEVDFGELHRIDEDGGEGFYEVASPMLWAGKMRLVLGMVRTNEPLMTAPKLSGALAAATAAGAFGVFFSSIWKMADALPPWRLALITLMAIVVMVTWLIFGHRLWERRHHLGSLMEANIYNASTVVTLLLTVSLLYLVLFLVIFVAAVTVIESSFLAESLGKHGTIRNYLNIAWLSASMGTVAGAVGSSFDSNVDVRRLTHGRRQLMRYPDASTD